MNEIQSGVKKTTLVNNNLEKKSKEKIQFKKINKGRYVLIFGKKFNLGFLFQLSLVALALASAQAGIVGQAALGHGYAGLGGAAIGHAGYAAAPVAVAAPVGVAYGHGAPRTHDIDYYVSLQNKMSSVKLLPSKGARTSSPLTGLFLYPLASINLDLVVRIYVVTFAFNLRLLSILSVEMKKF